MKRSVLVALLFAFALVGCNKDEPAAPATPAAVEEPAAPVVTEPAAPAAEPVAPATTEPAAPAAGTDAAPAEEKK